MVVVMVLTMKVVTVAVMLKVMTIVMMVKKMTVNMKMTIITIVYSCGDDNGCHSGNSVDDNVTMMMAIGDRDES